MTEETLQLIEKLIQVHDEGVRNEGGGSSSDAWGPGSLRVNREETYWSPSTACERYGDVPTLPLLEYLRDLVAFARSKLDPPTQVWP